MPLRRLATTAVALIAAATLAACGSDGPVSHADTEGVYVTTGDLAYQVQISRQLNASDFEDRDFLKGLPAGAATLPTGQEWFGVFIRVFNRTNSPHPAASQFVIRDTTGQEFQPVPLGDVNVEAYRPLVLKGGDQLPLPGSVARENGTQGGLVLFRIPSAAYANRPLELTITPPDGGREATVDLDV
ncbi:hypothetical protein FSW04_22240 [Baekduia soli]|uniref:DUF4352 domain-containing protein n=1 Tax=Baekduia soli TaxID=496014 RepID=A0A5B8UAE1_9ACTN|nr:hypothetical protein [Baekduia soli]QEC50020.1 hypothetical protein FSW04_22240 [Baekduia soli]